MRTVICLLVLLLVAGCGSSMPSESAIQTAIAETQVAPPSEGAIQTAIAQTQVAQPSPSPEPSLQPPQDIPTATEAAAMPTQDQPAATSSPPVLETTQATEPIESPCEVEKWEIVPTGVYEYPDSDGWKIIIIQIAVRNGSSHWGSLSINRDALQEAVVTTEGGFSYQTHRQMSDSYLLPQEPTDSPYSGAWVIPSRVSTNLLPPGFSYRGDLSLGTSGRSLRGDPERWQQLIFRVPETQEHFLVSIPTSTVWCYGEDGQSAYTKKPPVNWDLDQDVRQLSFPTDRPSSDFQEFEGSTIAKGQAVFLFEAASRADWWESGEGKEELDLLFSMQNTNEGYDTEEEFDAYVIGDDGIGRRTGCSGGCRGIEGLNDTWRTRAGPGQVVQRVVGYIIHPDVRNLKLVCFDPAANFFAIFNILDEQ